MAKLAETTYRDLNIALPNELAVYSEQIGVDVSQVIDASISQPFSHIHRPGVAVGGHCIPVYPHFMLAGAPDMRLPRVARQVNSAMPSHVVRRLSDLIAPLEGRKVAILGAAYRGGVKEAAFSGVFGLARELARAGAIAVVHDPMYTADELTALGFEPHELGSHCEAAIVQTDHAEYRSLSPSDLPGAVALIDGRRVVEPERFDDTRVRLIRLGDGRSV